MTGADSTKHPKLPRRKPASTRVSHDPRPAAPLPRRLGAENGTVRRRRPPDGDLRLLPAIRPTRTIED